MPNFELNRNIVSGLELEGAVEGQLTQSLLPQLREVLFSSLVTSFGLDALVFDNPWLPVGDEASGHVDTLHNVTESQKRGENPEKMFKKAAHSEAYSKKLDAYKEQKSYKDDNGKKIKEKEAVKPYRKNDNYIETGRVAKQRHKDGILRDGYTGEILKSKQEFERDHVMSVEEHRTDARYALSGLNSVEEANHDTNLVITHHTLNESKKAETLAKAFEKWEKNRPSLEREAAEIRVQLNDGTAPPGAGKKLDGIEAKLAALDNSEEAMKKDWDARKAQSRRHDWAYYTSRDFFGTTSGYAIAAGGKMAAKQALGLVLMELFIAVQQEWPSMLRDWRNAPDWQTKLDPRPLLERVAAVLRTAWERIKGKAGQILSEAKSGFAAGVLSEIVTTIINIFTGTAKSIMRLLRNFWAGIINSLKILIFNPDNLGAEEKLAAVMRILSVAIGGMIQPIVAEAIDKLMMAYAGFVPSFLREVLSQFVGAALGGVVSVSLVYAIDHSPVVHRIIEFTRSAGAFTDAVYRNIANLTGLSWQTLKAQTGVLEAQANLAIKMNDLADQQDANYSRYTGMTIRYQIITHVLSISEDHLATAISTSDNAIAVREDTIFALRQGFENWEQDGASLSQIISDYKIEE